MNPNHHHGQAYWALALVTAALLAGCASGSTGLRSLDDPTEQNPDLAPDPTAGAPFGSDRLAHGDFLGELAARDNPILARLRLFDGNFHLEEILEGESPSLSTGSSYPAITIYSDEWLADVADGSSRLAILIVPEGVAPHILAVLTDDFRVHYPSGYEDSRAAAARLLKADGRELLAELLMRAQTDDPVTLSEIDPVAAWHDQPPSARFLDLEATPASILHEVAIPVAISFDLPEASRAEVEEDGVVSEDELIVLTLSQPEIAVIYSTALSAGDHVSTLWLPDGPILAELAHPLTGERLAVFDLGELRSSWEAADAAGEVLEVRVEGDLVWNGSKAEGSATVETGRADA